MGWITALFASSTARKALGLLLAALTIALFLLNFVFAGLIGGCVLVWRLLVAAWYVPLTLYRLLTAGCACIITED